MDDGDVLSNETRREILIMLRDGERSAGDVARALNRAAPTVSEHLNKLRSAGLIVCRQVGVYRFFRVDPRAACSAWNRHLGPRKGR